MIQLQSKYSAHSACYLRITFINREQIVLLQSNFQFEIEFRNHLTVASFEITGVD